MTDGFTFYSDSAQMVDAFDALMTAVNAHHTALTDLKSSFDPDDRLKLAIYPPSRFAYLSGDFVPDGFKTRKDGSLIPDGRKAAGKKAAALIHAHNSAEPVMTLPGLPFRVMQGNYVYRPSCFGHDGWVYAIYKCPRDPAEKDNSDFDGPVDLTLWKRCLLSHFYTAKEAHESTNAVTPSTHACPRNDTVTPCCGKEGKRMSVLQLGVTPDTVPWEDIDAVFIGGPTRFKHSPEANACVQEARARGLWVHLGRANSYRSISLARAHGCDSADGTFLRRAVDINVPRLERIHQRLAIQPELPLYRFTLVGALVDCEGG